MVHVTSPLSVALQQLRDRYNTGAFMSAVLAVAIYWARRESKKQFKSDLPSMTDHMLKDMGITRSNLHTEARKHFHDYR